MITLKSLLPSAALGSLDFCSDTCFCLLSFSLIHWFCFKLCDVVVVDAGSKKMLTSARKIRECPSLCFRGKRGICTDFLGIITIILAATNFSYFTFRWSPWTYFTKTIQMGVSIVGCLLWGLCKFCSCQLHPAKSAPFSPLVEFTRIVFNSYLGKHFGMLE